MTDTYDEAEPLEPEQFLSALHSALRPELLMRAGDDLAEVIAAVKTTRKAGKFTLAITVKPDEHNPDVAVVTGDTTVKAPRTPIHGRHMWPLENGRLSNRDPRQMEIDGLRAVSAPHTQNAHQEGTA